MLDSLIMAQVFAQLVDFLLTKEKKPLSHFKNHPVVEKFNDQFSYFLHEHFLFQVGFTHSQRSEILNTKLKLVKKIY